ncbi:hypothetical protein [Nocardia sp. IFM 10818]
MNNVIEQMDVIQNATFVKSIFFPEFSRWMDLLKPIREFLTAGSSMLGSSGK